MARAEPNAVELPQVPPFGTGTCIENLNGDGAMGIHLLLQDRVDDKLVPTEPEALLYEKRNDGSYKLTGVEYIVASAERPTLYGQEFDETNLARYGNPARRSGRCTSGSGSRIPTRAAGSSHRGTRGSPATRRTTEMRKITLLGLAALTAAAFASVAPAAAPGHRHDMSTMSGNAASQQLASQLALGRLATAKYATNLALAKRNGYGVITQMIPDMGWHFMNPKITTFDIRKPPILVYGKRGSTWQLVAFEWVFPKKPAKAPLPGATYGSFGAACHYKDGTFAFQASQESCATTSPQSGAAFNFWHPDLVTMHVWLWYPNPDGVFAGMNPLMRPFNGG